jgi:beta-1,4-N-acetylglucosaminyltransferase
VQLNRHRVQYVLLVKFLITSLAPMRAFVTVGSTRFDDLVQQATTEDVLLSLSRGGYSEVCVQCGNSSFEFSSLIGDGSVYNFERAGVFVSCWKFKPTLEDEFERADLIISHAGKLWPMRCV